MNRNQQPYIPEEDFVHRFLELSQEWYWELDSKGQIIQCSRQAEQILGYTSEELIGLRLISLMCRDDDNNQDAAVFLEQRLRNNEAVENLVCGFYDKDQTVQYLQINAQPTGHRAIAFHGVASRLPVHTSWETTLHNLADGFSSQTGASFFRSLVTHLAKLFKVDYALIGEFTGENREMVRVIVVHARGEIAEDFQYPLKGTPCEEVFSGKLSCYSQNVQAMFPEDPMLPDMNANSYLGAPLFTADGRINGIMAVIHSQPFAHLGTIQSIFKLYVARAAAELERQQIVHHLEHLAHRDDLTGLCNRNMFTNLLDQSLARAKRNGEMLGLMFLDLDNFKDINDTMGHEAGDKVLTIIAQRLEQTVRQQDTVARIGGDEFVILLSELHQIEDVQKVSEKVIKNLRQSIDVALHIINITTSIGIAIHPSDGDSSSSLMKNADIALYRAKSAGRNTYQLYSHEMGQAMQKKIKMEARLRQAVRDKEFELHYQPKINLLNGQIYGVEALIRWHRTKETVSPELFIPLLEETGAIVKVGAWVMDTALKDLQQCVDQLQRPINLSVNVSAKQLTDSKFLSSLFKSLEESAYDPHRLELEITESVLIEEGKQIIDLLQTIRDEGIRICLDDFGTGYSSLIYLKRFPVDFIKIDKSFIKNIDKNEDDAVVVKAMIELADALRIGIVAEGVETQSQRSTLLDIGCTCVQGYLYSEAIAINAFTKLMSKY